MHFFYRAYTFTSPLLLPQIRDTLNKLGPWEWIDRDNDDLGEYLSAHIPEDSWLKLYVRGTGAYQLDIKFRPEMEKAVAEKAFDVLHERVKTVLLPGLKATQIVPTPPVDR